MNELYLNKINFVKELSDAIVKVQTNIQSIRYEVYHNNKYDYNTEVLVINYFGGGKSVRSCNGNSYSAIFEEIANKLNSGYYDELRWYDALVNDPDTELLR